MYPTLQAMKQQKNPSLPGDTFRQVYTCGGYAHFKKGAQTLLSAGERRAKRNLGKIFLSGL